MLRIAAGDGPRDRGTRRARRRHRQSTTDLARTTVSTAELEPGLAAAADQVRRLRLVEPPLDAGAARPGRGRRWPRRATRAGTSCSSPSASTSTRSGREPTSRSTASRGCSRRCASACSTSLQAGARSEGRAIPAKGLTGSGYDGHAFWDTETFVLPLLIYSVPRRRARRAALAPRDARAGPGAGARSSGSKGAAFPWRTIRGEECSGYWPAGTAAFHVNADIANAAARYLQATGGRGLRPRRAGSSSWSRRRGCGARSATTTPAAPFASTGSPARTSTRRSPTTTSTPTSRAAQPASTRPISPSGCPSSPARHGVDDEEAAAWRDAADRDDDPVRRGARASTSSRRTSPATRAGTSTRPRPTNYPLFLHYPYFDIYRKQVVKQADLVLALHLFGDSFTAGGEGARLRLLRAADRARLVALGLHPGGRRGRGRPPRPRLRVRDRGRADGPRRPRAQHPRRRPHGLARGRLDRRRRRLRRHARSRRVAQRSRRACRNSSTASASGSASATRGGRGRRSTDAETTYELVEGDELTISHHGEELELEGGKTVEAGEPAGRAAAGAAAAARPGAARRRGHRLTMRVAIAADERAGSRRSCRSSSRAESASRRLLPDVRRDDRRRPGRGPRPGRPRARRAPVRDHQLRPHPRRSRDDLRALRGRSAPTTDTAMLVGLRTRVDAVMIGAGTMRAERYGRVDRRPGEARAPRARGPVARSADGDRLGAPRPALGRAAVHRGPRASADRDRLRRRAAADRDPGEPVAPRGRASTWPRCSPTCAREHGVRALLCEGGPRLHGRADRRRARRRALRHPRAEARRRRRPRPVAGLAEERAPGSSSAGCSPTPTTGELFGRYLVP